MGMKVEKCKIFKNGFWMRNRTVHVQSHLKTSKIRCKFIYIQLTNQTFLAMKMKFKKALRRSSKIQFYKTTLLSGNIVHLINDFDVDQLLILYNFFLCYQRIFPVFDVKLGHFTISTFFLYVTNTHS